MQTENDEWFAGDPATLIAEYQCDGCGLCCRELIIEPDIVDVLREPRLNQGRPDGSQQLSLAEMCLEDKIPVIAGNCQFLGDHNRCQIYATRPQECVAFLAGCAKCQNLRSRAGLDPLQPDPRPTWPPESVLNQGIPDEPVRVR